MKKTFVLALAIVMAISLTACGGNPASGDEGAGGNSGQVSQGDLDDLDKALEQLEKLTPEGWDSNQYRDYIYDVWDSDFLPDCFPAQIDGVEPSQTSFKDYDQDEMNSDYSVGRLDYEGPEDYHKYSVSFYCTEDQLSAFMDALRAKGMKGGLYSGSDGPWLEYDFAGNGWYMYIFFNTNDDQDGKFDGCATATATDDLWEHPASISGIPLPQVGVPGYDYGNDCWVETYNMDTGESEGMDFDLASDSLPIEGVSYWMYFDYHGTELQDAKDYAQLLVGEGWELQYENENEGSYTSSLYKDGIYAISNWVGYLEIGFSDMIENLQY